MENDVLKVRSPSSLLYNVINKMSDDQRKVVTRMGFKSILELKVEEIPRDLGYYVVSQVDTTEMVIRTPHGNIRIDEEAVHEVYGFPMGKTALNCSRLGNSNADPTIKSWKKHLYLGRGSISPRSLATQMESRKATDFMFKVDFLVLMVSTLVQTMQNGSVYLWFLQSLTQKSEIKEFNWCEFVVNAVKESKNAWKPDDKNSKFVGPLTFLVLLFCDRVCIAPELERVRPMITKWNTADLTKFQLDGMKNGFGSYELLPTWKETASGKAYLLLTLHSEKDIHFEGFGCTREEEADVGEGANEKTEEETIEEVNRLLENLATARDYVKMRLVDAVGRFGENEDIQSLKEKWHLTFSKEALSFEKPSNNAEERHEEDLSFEIPSNDAEERNEEALPFEKASNNVEEKQVGEKTSCEQGKRKKKVTFAEFPTEFPSSVAEVMVCRRSSRHK